MSKRLENPSAFNFVMATVIAIAVGVLSPSAWSQEDGSAPEVSESEAVQVSDADDADAVAAESVKPTEVETEADTEPNATTEPEGTSAGGPPIEQPDAGEAIDSTRNQLEQWVETRRIIAQEKQDLKLSKEMLNERISLVQNEINALKEKIKEAEANIAKTDEQYDELTAENDRLKEASDLLSTTIAKMEANTKKLLASAPTPVVDRIKVLSQQIPDDPNETKLTVSTRFQNVIGILNDINKFNSEITVTSKTLDLPDGGKAEVTVMYLGASKAYYVGGNGKFGGVGTPGDDGWDWRATNDMADRIATVIDVYNNKQVAQFVQLPAEIK